MNFIELFDKTNLMRKIISVDMKAALVDHDGLGIIDSFSALFNQEIVQRGQTSSANGNCSARDNILFIFSLISFCFMSCYHSIEENSRQYTWETVHKGLSINNISHKEGRGQGVGVILDNDI